MFEQMTSSDRQGTGATLTVLVAGIAGGALLTVLLAWLAFDKHPPDWSTRLTVEQQREIARLAPRAQQEQTGRAIARAREQRWHQTVRFLLIELLLVPFLHRAWKQHAPGPAVGTAFGIAFGTGALAYSTGTVLPAYIGLGVSAYLLYAIRVADQWEKFVILRFGRFHSLRGPGVFAIVPGIDCVAKVVDDRVRTTAVHAEAALTRDTVPVHVDSIAFWDVWDARKAALEVDDYDRAVALAAQTALLQAIGRHDLRAMLTDRQSLAAELQDALADKTTAWGVTVESVEIRDVRLPGELQRVLSRQAQAERERQARNTLGDAEVDIAGRFAEAARAYQNDPVALHLRAMNMLYEAIKENGRMVVVPTGPWRRHRRRLR